MKRLVLVSVVLALLAPYTAVLACDDCDNNDTSRVRRFMYQMPVGGFARQLSMGGNIVEPEVVLNPYLVRDMSRLYVNPAYLTHYKNAVLANVGGGELTGLSSGSKGFGHQTGAVSVGLNDNWYAGALIGHNPTHINWVNKLAVNGGGQFPGIIRRQSLAIPDIENSYTGMVAYMPDTTFRIGAALTYGWNKHDTSASSITPAFQFNESRNSKAFQIRVGGLYTFPGGSELEAYTAYTSDKANDTRTVNGTSDGDYSVSGNEFLFSTRYVHPCEEKWKFSALGSYYRASAEPKENSAPQVPTFPRVPTQKFTMTNYSVGVGTQYSTRRLTIAGGLSYVYSQSKAEYTDSAANASVKTTTTGFPVMNVGVEYNLSRHFTVRAGHYRTGQTTETERTTPNGTTTGSNSTPNSTVPFGGLAQGNPDGFYTLGLGYRTGRFSADATVSEEALRRGLGTIGSNDDINSFGYISLNFRF